MATSSIQGGETVPARPSGTDVDALGPSDSTDSGSDVQHERRMPTDPDNAGELGSLPARRRSTTDAQGTGERASAIGDVEDTEGPDIVPDHVEDLAVDTGDDSEAEG